MKNIKIVVISTIVTISILVLAILSPWIILFFGTLISPNPPKPQITYGEFPFTIKYKINNEIITYNDIVICEYAGIENCGTGGKERKWNRKLKSGNQYITLLESKTSESYFEVYLPIPGLPEYYMGDFKKSQAEYESVMKNDRYLGYKQNDINHSITKEEVWDKYHIKVLSIECSSPIKNEFK